MAVDGIDKWLLTRSRKVGGSVSEQAPYSGRLSLESERAGAGRDGRTCPARPNSQARTGTGKSEDWQPHPVDPYTLLLKVMVTTYRQYMYMVCIDSYIPCALMTTASTNMCVHHPSSTCY